MINFKQNNAEQERIVCMNSVDLEFNIVNCGGNYCTISLSPEKKRQYSETTLPPDLGFDMFRVLGNWKVENSEFEEGL